MNTIEEFRDIKGYEGLYQVSNLGRIKSIKGGKERIRILRLGKNGYLRINLSKDNNVKTKRIHQLVAIAFLNHTPQGYKGFVVNHINQDRLDNRLDNLEIVSWRDNANKKHLPSTSKYTGVSWSKVSKKWISAIYINGKSKTYLGSFTNELDASKAYEDALVCVNENRIEDIIKPIRPIIGKSKYLGVCWCKRKKRWLSIIRVNGKPNYLGSFTNELDASKAYESALKNITK